MSRLAVALDFPDAARALAFASAIKGRVEWLKVGLELFVAAGPEAVSRLRDLGFSIFLDLKFYDIPNTAAAAAAAAARLGAGMLTAHCQGGEKMCAAIMASLSRFENPPLALGVTALTSFGPGEMPGIGLDPGEFGLDLAGNAANWGLNGVVCSAREVGAIKKRWPNLICVCPGIRPAGSGGDDQRRTLAPGDAVRAGADFLVVGRPITRAGDPVAAVEAVLEEMA